MKHPRLFALVVVFGVGGAVFAAGCEGGGATVPNEDASTEASTGADSSGLGTGSSDGGAHDGDAGDRTGVRSHGACAVDGDCPSGTCVELTPGGYKACNTIPAEPQTCVDGGEGLFPNECCGTCDGGICTLHRSCGPAQLDPYNVCISDGCSSDGACGDVGVCLPAALAGVRSCLTGNECRAHADCSAAPDGMCVPGGLVGPLTTCAPYDFSCNGRALGALRCVYGSECAADADCADGHCELVGGRPVCQPGTRSPCPPPP